ncbi:hypothetical protein CJ010_14610 [Azoarcus sp. DD4]|uniref:tyrosine-type recombinase/integrase n=1 Tax=Azoarcus sp. DD4 TaxID=2027405 RepID=UPI001126C767|nr:site-specific integrase [Azoarcus sp. DD4]QDF97675.1 hypothetical protein CJ010_14610 [Azoarcus sp. DD4]
MATFRKRGAVYQVQVCRLGVRKSASFSRLSEARAWAATVEAEIFAGVRGVVLDKPVSALLERYRDEVSVRKRGERWERMRIGLFLRDKLADVRLPNLSPADVAAWRDRRLAQVSAASVLREWVLLSHAFTVAVKEWRWLRENPFQGVARPKAPPSRDRRISQNEIDRLLLGFGYRLGEVPDTVTARCGAAFCFAIETAMRASEICGLTWANVSGPVARLPLTKNGSARSVPLSPVALSILDTLPRGDGPVFGLVPSQIDALFRKVKRRALIDDLHFHDTRHEAITRLARKLDVLDLARMVGVRDLRILMVYYNAKPDEIAARLAV